jgi:hypothetical protein
MFAARPRIPRCTWTESGWAWILSPCVAGARRCGRQARFTQAAYGTVQVIGWWDSAYDEPLYLITNLTDCDTACRCYQKRMHIETLFSDQKSRGFQLHRSHLRDPQRLLIAACLAYLWIIYLGTLAAQPN